MRQTGKIDLCKIGLCLGQGRQQFMGVAAQHLTGWGQHDRLCLSIKKPRANCGFQCSDVLAYPRRGAADPAGRANHGPCFFQRNEHAQSTQG